MDLAKLTPKLPADLERQIFEVASLVWPRSIPRFLLVAWRVNTWVEPLLYRIFIMHDARAPSVLQSRSHLLLGSHTLDETEEAYLLSACSKVENLWLSAQTFTTLLQIDMPLNRLHCRLNTLFEPKPTDFTHQLFASMTHLEVFDLPVRYDVWATVTHLPCLTHLAFNDVLALMLYNRAQMETQHWKECDVMDVRFVAWTLWRSGLREPTQVRIIGPALKSLSRSLYKVSIFFILHTSLMRLSFPSRGRKPAFPTGKLKSIASRSSNATPDILESSLISLSDSADACAPLKTVVGTAMALWKIAQRAKDSRKEACDIALRAETIVNLIADAVPDVQAITRRC
ncbi:hypothetical protein C8R47DRAFT_1225270 [Mycena vitilis]|nr:hypothetical protein C8R47DRAFT_1225270 [Mycena vitilis]